MRIVGNPENLEVPKEERRDDKVLDEEMVNLEKHSKINNTFFQEESQTKISYDDKI